MAALENVKNCALQIKLPFDKDFEDPVALLKGVEENLQEVKAELKEMKPSKKFEKSI